MRVGLKLALRDYMKTLFNRRHVLAALTGSVVLPGVAFASPPATSLRPVARPGSAKPVARTADSIIERANPVSYTHLTLPTTPYV